MEHVQLGYFNTSGSLPAFRYLGYNFIVLYVVGKMHIRVSTVIKESKPLHAG